MAQRKNSEQDKGHYGKLLFTCKRRLCTIEWARQCIVSLIIECARSNHKSILLALKLDI